MAYPNIDAVASADTGITNAANITINVPAHAEGDILVAFVAVDNVGYTLTPNESGWTLLVGNTASDWRTIWTRTAGASEPASYQFNTSTNEGLTGCIFAVSGGDDVANWVVDSVQDSATNHEAPSISPTAAENLLVCLWAFDHSASIGLTPPGSMTTFVNRSSTGGDFHPTILGCHEDVGSGATGTRTATLTASRASTITSIAIPAPASGGSATGTIASTLAAITQAALNPVTLANTFEGLTDGTVVTAGNSGGASGDAFDGVNLTVTARTATPVLGNVYAEVESDAYLRWPLTGGPRCSGRMYVRFPSLPVGTVRLLQLRDSGTTTLGGVDVDASGNVGVLTGSSTEVAETTLGVSAGSWFRIEWLFTAAGAYTLHVFLDPDSETPDETLSGTTTFGTFAQARIGSTNAGETVLVDGLLVSDAAVLPGRAAPRRDGTATSTLPAISTDADGTFDADVPVNLLNNATATLEDTGLTDGDSVTTATDWSTRSSGGVTSNPLLDTSEVISGTASMRRTKNGTAATNWDPWDLENTACPVSPSTQYTFRCELRMPDGAANCRVIIEWLDNPVTGVLGTAIGSPVSVAATGSTVVHVTGTSHASAGYARAFVRVDSIAANARVIGDQFSLHEGTSTDFPASTFTGTSAQTLPSFTQDADGTFSDGSSTSTGTIASTLQPITTAATGTGPGVGLGALLIVGDASSPHSGEQDLRNRLLTEHGFVSVEFYDDNLAEKTDADTYDLIIIGASVVSATVGTKYSNEPVPLLNMEAFAWDEGRISSDTATNWVDDDGIVTNAALAGLPTGTYTLHSNTGVGVLYGVTKASLASGVTSFMDYAGDTTYTIGWRAESGATLASGTAQNRRVGLGFEERSYDFMTADGWAILDRQVQWLLGGATGTSAQTLPAFTSAAAGRVHDIGTAASVLQPVSQAAAGTVADPTTEGTAASTLPAFTTSVTGRVHDIGTAASTLGAVTSAATGTILVPFLQAVANGATQIDLSWSSIPQADGYDIERDGVIIIYNHPTTSYSDTGLAAATEYDYRVRAVL